MSQKKMQTQDIHYAKPAQNLITASRHARNADALCQQRLEFQDKNALLANGKKKLKELNNHIMILYHL